MGLGSPDSQVQGKGESGELVSLLQIWRLLVAEKPVQCASTGVVHPVAMQPALVVLDVRPSLDR